uniref:Bromodomain adjacent to zinc finger domain 2B n=1 Tax=Myripristis murdjan TaxID=586833 RepID=A0A668AEE3_9TELE
MESGERLASPSSTPSSLHMASSSASSSSAPAPPQTPTAKCSPAPGPAGSSLLTTCGHLFRTAGDQHFNMSGISSAFPLTSHPAFGLCTTSSGRSEFGGLGTLGVSAALAAHSQFGSFPDWWRASEAHARGAAAFFPPLLGLPPMFTPAFQNHDPAQFQLRTPSKNGQAAAKGVNGTVNGGSISSPSTGNSAANLSPFPAKASVEKTKATNSSSRSQKSSQDLGQVQHKTIQKTKEKKLNKKSLETSSMSGSQSGSSSESSSDGESSSDLDDLEEEDDNDEDDDEDQSNDSEESDSEKESHVKRKLKGLTQNTSERKKRRPCSADENTTQDSKSVLAQQHHDNTSLSSSYLLQTSSHPSGMPQSVAPLFQSPRTREEEGKQHTSVIQATGLAASNSPLTAVAQSHREASPLTPRSSPKPFSLSSSPKHFPPSTSPKHISQSSSPKHNSLSSSPKPLALCSSPKPLSLCTSPKLLSLASSKPPSLSSSPKPPTLSPSQKSSHTPKSLTPSPKHTRLVDSMKESSRNFLDETSLHMNSFKLKQDSFKLAFPLPPKSQDLYKSLKNLAPSSSSLTPPKLSSEAQSSHILPQLHSNHTNLFLNHHPNGVIHNSTVQDAPLALITKPRSQSRASSSKPLVAATSPPFPMPVNLSTGIKEPLGPSAAPLKASTSSGLAHRPRKNKTPRPLLGGKSLSKSNLSCSAVDLIIGTESDIPSSKDSDDSFGEEEDDDDDDDEEDDEDDVDDEDSVGSLSESESNLESNSNGSEDEMKEHGETETDTDAERTPQKLGKASFSAQKSSCSLSASSSLLSLQVIRPPRLPTSSIVTPVTVPSSGVLTNHITPSSSVTLATPPGSGKRRRVTDERVLRLPLEMGWQRETRIRAVAGRLQGEVAYYAPCGKKLRQYPDVMKYLLRNGITEISRDNFSFSTKIKVGDFYEAREGPEGLQWFLLTEEEIIPTIIAMDGRRSRRTKSEHQQTGDGAGARQRKGQPPNVGETNFQDVKDAKLLRKLEAQEIARQAAQIKMMRKLEKQAMAQAAKEARRQQAIIAAEERRKKKEQMKILKQQEKIKRIQQIRMEKELRAQQILEAKRKKKEEAANAKILEAEKRNKEKEMRRQQAVVLKHQERERRRQHMMLMKAMEARKKAEERERLKQEKKDEKRLNKERKLELKRLELEMAKELKKPNEDMCLADHKPLPELSRISGLVLPGNTFSDCLMVLQFLRSFGKVLGFDVSASVPNLSKLQEGLLNIGDSMGLVQDLLVHMLSAAVCDPGPPPGQRTKTALGDHLSNVEINRDNVSEILQIYMEAHCEHTDLAELALSLKTKAFQAHTPSQKASILAFLVNELCCSKAVVSEIDKNIDHMTNLRKDKWVVEGKLRKLRSIHSKKTGKRESSMGGEDSQTLGTPTAGRKRKRKEGDSEEEDDEDEDSEDQGDEDDEEEEEVGGKKGKKVEICEEEDDSDHTASVEELEKQIEKSYKQQCQIRRKLFESSHSLRSMILGQDRYKRRYWVLPQCGGIFVEGMDSGEGCEELERERKRQRTTQLIKVEEKQLEEEEKPVVSSPAGSTDQESAIPETQQGKDTLNLFLQKPGSFSKLSKLLEVAKMSPESNNNSPNSQNSCSTKVSTPASYPSYHNSQTRLSCSPSPASSQLAKTDTSVPSLLSAPYLSSSPWMTCSPQLQVQNDQLSKVLTETNSQWFSLLPRSPCDESSVTSGSTPPASSSSPQSIRPKSPSSLSPNPPATASSSSPAGISTLQLSVLQQGKSGIHQMGLPFCGWSSAVMNPNLPFTGSPLPPMLDLAYQHTEGKGNGNSNPFLANSNSIGKSETLEPPSDKPTCAPFPAVEVAKTQDYPTPQPIPEDMLCGWWRVADMEELHTLVKVLHSRGIREKVLQKQIQKHMEYMAQSCAKSKEVAVIDVAELEEQQVSEATVESWCVEEQAMEADISLLQQVEDLERKVTSASLQVKGWIHPEPQSEREDLVYHEHKPFSVQAVEKKGQRDGSQEEAPGSMVRRPNNPLDIAVTRLAELERNIERSGEEELAPGMRLWRKALSEVRSAAQLSLCIQQLQKSIAWERSIMKVYCQLCRKGDNEELLLLCDGCDKGCHTYCHKPKITTIPEGDWFCPACIEKASGQSPRRKKQPSRTAGGGKKGIEVKRSRKFPVVGELCEDEAASPSTSSSGSSGSSCMPKKGTKESRKKKGEESPPRNQAKHDSPVSCVKKAKTAKDNSTSELAMCRMLLAELEAHQDAWPFLTPVNSKAVPGYKKVIKKPMDFSTIREKLINNQYLNLETFIVDVNLVFDNCEKFNEDDSTIGRAGHSMRRFFEKRWTELLKLRF